MTASRKKKTKRPWSRMAGHEAAISKACPALKRVKPAPAMDRARAARALLDSQPGLSPEQRKEVELDIFMAIFHPNHNTEKTK